MKRLTGALLVFAVACGGSDGGTVDDDTSPDAGTPIEEDTTSPTVISVTPANGATGVRADSTVTFEFSEPMDQLSVQNSLDTSDLGGVTFAWSNGGTTVVITPDAPLAYAEGEREPTDINAVQYSVVLGTGATDEAGNPLEIGEQTIFKTLKSVETTLYRDNDLTGAGSPAGVITDGDDFVLVGDNDGGGAAIAFRGYLTIDMSALPAEAVEIVSAQLEASQLATIGDPYGALSNGLGLLIEHASFTLGSEAEDNAAFNSAALSAIGTFATSSDSFISIDVTAQVSDDLANRADRSDRSQFRLRFDTFTNLDATADQSFIDREFEMKVVYLVP